MIETQNLFNENKKRGKRKKQQEKDTKSGH